MAASAKLRQLAGQTQDNFNFGPSLLKFKSEVLQPIKNCSLHNTLIPNLVNPLKILNIKVDSYRWHSFYMAPPPLVCDIYTNSHLLAGDKRKYSIKPTSKKNKFSLFSTNSRTKGEELKSFQGYARLRELTPWLLQLHNNTGVSSSNMAQHQKDFRRSYIIHMDVTLGLTSLSIIFTCVIRLNQNCFSQYQVVIFCLETGITFPHNCGQDQPKEHKNS